MEVAVVDRRRAQRLRHLDEHGILLARVRPGHEAWIVDVAGGGALIDTRHRLLPGSWIELFVQTAERRAVMRAIVVRCAVVRIEPAALWYRGAIGFDQPVQWLGGAGAAR